MPSTPPVENPLELEVMRRALQRAHGFGLYFVRANTPVLQKQLHTWLVENLTRPMLLIHLQSDEPIIEQLQAAELGVTEDAVLSVMGMDQMSKADDEGWLPRQLNWRREAFHRLKHPVLIWLPEYLLVQLMHTAPDFFDWHSGFFEFEMGEEAREEIHAQQLMAWDSPMLARSEGERRERIAVLRGLLDEYKKNKIEPFITAQALRTLGALHWEASEYNKAISYYKQALAIDQEIGNRRGEGADLGNLGLVYANLGEIRKSIEYYERSLEINQDIGERRGEGMDLSSLGLAHVNLGETHRAIEYYERALAIAIELGDRLAESIHLGNMGLAYAAQGEANKALDFYEHALEIAVQIGDRRGESNQLNSLGTIYKNLGENRKAIDLYERAIAIALEIGDRRGEGIHLSNLGLAYKNLGNIQKALEYYQRAVIIAQEIGDKHGAGIRLNNLGEAYADMGDFDSAKNFTRQALALFDQIESPHAEQARQRLAEWEKEEKQGQ